MCPQYIVHYLLLLCYHQNNEKQLPSSNLSFHPAPAVSPKGIQTTTASPSARSGYTQPLYSPPLPPPPAHPHSLASTPSTAVSPISPPPPIHEDGKESAGTVGYGVFKKSVEANRTEQRPIRRTTSELSGTYALLYCYHHHLMKRYPLYSFFHTKI